MINIIKKEFNLIGTFFEYFKPYKWHIILVETAMLISIGVQAVQPLIWGKIVVFLFEKNREKFLLYILYTMIIFFVNSVIDFIQQYSLENISEGARFELKKNICNIILRLPIKTINDMNLGEVYTRLEGDTSAVIEGIMNSIFTYVNNIVKVIVIGVVILKMNTFLAVIILLGTPVTALFAVKYGSIMKKINMEALHIQDDYSSLVQQIIYGIREIHAIRINSVMNKKYENEADKVKTKNMELVVKQNSYGIVGNAISFVMDTLILFIGGNMILNGSLIYEYYVAFSSYAQQFSQAYKKILNNNIAIQTTLNSVQRLSELIDSEKRYKSKHYKVIETKKCDGNIEFKNVSFKYNDSGYAVKNISFKIKKNTTVGIIGNNGSGKSTIVNLLLNLYDADEGEILMDGVNVNNISERSMERDIFPVMQNTFLFNTSIKENFLLIKPDATDEEIINACKKTYIHEFIESLPDKYDSKIGENGVSMSGGQRQRLILARCILKNSKILIFDEATSSIDKESVYCIKKMIEGLSKEHTIIIVTHDTSIFDIFDEIIYISDGQVDGVKTIQNSEVSI